MNFNQVKILFVLRKNKTNNLGQSPLVCRITFNSKRREFNTGFYVPEEEWNAKLQIVASKTAFAKNVNTHLNKMYREILTTYSEVVISQETFSVNDIYNAYILLNFVGSSVIKVVIIKKGINKYIF